MTPADLLSLFQPSDALRRWAEKVRFAPGDECWLWTAAGAPGYGWFYLEGRLVGAHVAAFRLFNGPIGDLDVCHACDVPSCVRPDHLFLGTAAENARDMVRKNRWNNQNKFKTQCKRGHQFDATNTLRTRIGRACRECRRQWHIARRISQVSSPS